MVSVPSATSVLSEPFSLGFPLCLCGELVPNQNRHAHAVPHALLGENFKRTLRKGNIWSPCPPPPPCFQSLFPWFSSVSLCLCGELIPNQNRHAHAVPHALLGENFKRTLRKGNIVLKTLADRLNHPDGIAGSEFRPVRTGEADQNCLNDAVVDQHQQELVAYRVGRAMHAGIAITLLRPQGKQRPMHI